MITLFQVASCVAMLAGIAALISGVSAVLGERSANVSEVAGCFGAMLAAFFAAAVLERLDKILTRMESPTERAAQELAKERAEQAEMARRLQEAEAAVLLRKTGGDMDLAAHLARKAARPSREPES